ncbi:hypothetical protein QT381_11035 [Galbitalea sp. SE-J8]|uniref:Ig-like domain repeat protein n=1 Tax=Galbitalea sp. SE-J8 TaxID=3054952 RepID=UPI00259CC6C8|nr:hypothetical protein [Galbitalea sp. SE-J8]MDM4763544.1 hypothetical protein [Galbitalea sp. SE-J8]
MRTRRLTAIGAVVAIAAASLLAATPASANSASFPNPLAASSGLRITSIDANYDETSLVVTQHVADVAPTGDWSTTLVILPQPTIVATGTPPDIFGVIFYVTAGVADLQVVHVVGSTSVPVDPAGVSVLRNDVTHTITTTIPTATVPYPGDIYLVSTLQDSVAPDQALAAQSYSGTELTGLGPIRPAPAPTSIVATATSSTQSVDGPTAAIIAIVNPSGAAGSVQVLDGGSAIASAPVTNGIAVVPIPSTLAVGDHTLTSRFVPADDTAFASSLSSALPFTVKSIVGPAGPAGPPGPAGPAGPAASPASKATTTALALSKPSQKHGSKKVAKLTVTVSPTAAGTVAVYDGTKVLKTLTVKKGKASYAFPKTLKKGAHKIRAVFVPSNFAAFAASASKTVKFTVKK